MLQGKVVVITGGSSGIGAEMALLLAKHGAIPILMARSESKLLEVAQQIQGEKGIFVLDVTSTEQVFDTMEQVISRYGKIDILINNAGFAIFELFVDAPLEHFDEMMEVNYMGTVRCTKAVLPHMLERRTGQIINIASMAGKFGSAKASAYSATKHAVLGFTNCLRQELMGTGVTVSAVNPGPVDTPFFNRADPTGNYKNNMGWFLLKPEKVAKAVLQVIIHKKCEMDVPFLVSIGTKVYHLFPRLADKIVYRLINKK